MHDNIADARKPEFPLGGASRSTALLTFLDCCNTPTTLFVTERWFAPKREVLLKLLSDPITDDQAQALGDALRQAASLDEVIEWLGSREAIGWRDYVEQEAKRKLQAEIYGGFPWADVDACRLDTTLQEQHALGSRRARTLASLRENTPNCKLCGASFDQLAYFYFRSPPWTWAKLCGEAGWLVVCDQCRVQVEFHLEVMN